MKKTTWANLDVIYSLRKRERNGRRKCSAIQQGKRLKI